MENTQTEVAVFFKIIQQYRLLQTSVCRHYHIVLFFSLWNPKPLVSPFVSQWCSSVTHNSPSSKPLKWRPVFDDRCLRDRFQVLRAERLSAWQLNRTHLHLKWLFGLLLLPWRPRRFGPPLTVLTISFHYIGVFYIYMYIYIYVHTHANRYTHTLSHTHSHLMHMRICALRLVTSSMKLFDVGEIFSRQTQANGQRLQKRMQRHENQQTGLRSTIFLSPHSNNRKGKKKKV